MSDTSTLSDLVGVGGGSVFGAIAFGVALLLKKQWEKKEEKKVGRDTSVMERPVSEWLRSFLEAMTDDRREMKDLFKELATEIRQSNEKTERLSSRVDGLSHQVQNSRDSLGSSMARVEAKTDSLLQRRHG